MSYSTICSPPAADSRAADGLANVRLSEANHRIANNLAMISSLVRMYGAEFARQAQEVSRGEIHDFLTSISARIDAVGRLHRRLSAETAPTELALAPYLRDLCEDLASVCPPDSVTFVYQLDTGCRVSVDQVTPLCLIVSEVVTNSLKYAHPAGVGGQIRVACHRSARGDLFITVSDDGVGLPEGFDPVVDGGLGLRVVQKLTQQLDAACHFESTELGLQFRLVVPGNTATTHTFQGGARDQA